MIMLYPSPFLRLQAFRASMPHWFLLLLLYSIVFPSTDSTRVMSFQYSDDEIEAMNISSLTHLESDLRVQNSAVDKEISSLKGRLAKLQKKQSELEKERKKMDNAKEWETRQKDARAKELSNAKEELESKRSQLVSLTKTALSLRDKIQDIDEKLKSLRKEDNQLEDEISHPKLLDIVSNEAEAFGPITKEVFNKTVETLSPDVMRSVGVIEHFRDKLKHSSLVVSVLSSLLLYTMAISVCCACYQYFRQIQRKLTLSRIMFTLDMTSMLLWIMILVLHGILGQDPLNLLAIEYADISVLTQISLMGILICNVAIRCFEISHRLSLQAVLELVIVVLITQHYYQSAWIPILMNSKSEGSAWKYFAYTLMNGSLGIYRARTLNNIESRTTNYSLDTRSIRTLFDWILLRLKKFVGKYISIDWLGKESSSDGYEKSSLIQEYRDYHPVRENRFGNTYGEYERSFNRRRMEFNHRSLYKS